MRGAERLLNKQGVSKVINNPYKTVAGYHWCTDLNIFDNVELKGGEGSNNKTKEVYCYETKQKFISITEAAKFYGVNHSNISIALDNPNKTSAGFHWHTNNKNFNLLETKYKYTRKKILCWETKEWFKSMAEIEIRYSGKPIGVITKVINNPNKTAYGYHWCNNLYLFNGIELSKVNRPIFCYETRKKFKSRKEAEKFLGLNISTQSINNKDRTTGGFHWCDNLEIFEGVELTSGVSKIVYCYETKEKFNSYESVSIKYNLKNSTPIYQCLDNNNKTSCGFHWCTDLSVFDNIELFYPKEKVSSYEREIVEFLRFNNISNIVISDRKVLSGKELDIYLPDYNLAIEFNGDYWHSIEFKDINYHQDKTLKCLEKGIELISIFEFQWNENKELYLNYILDRINGIDRPDLELDENNRHILQFCNKKYFTEKQDISEPKLLNYENYNVYDCGKLKLTKEDVC